MVGTPGRVRRFVTPAGGTSSTRVTIPTLDENRLPATGFEILDAARQHTEEVLLGIRVCAPACRWRCSTPPNATDAARDAIEQDCCKVGDDGCSPTQAGCWPTAWSAPAGRLRPTVSRRRPCRTPARAGWSGSAAPPARLRAGRLQVDDAVPLDRMRTGHRRTVESSDNNGPAPAPSSSSRQFVSRIWRGGIRTSRGRTGRDRGGACRRGRL